MAKRSKLDSSHGEKHDRRNEKTNNADESPRVSQWRGYRLGYRLDYIGYAYRLSLGYIGYRLGCRLQAAGEQQQKCTHTQTSPRSIRVGNVLRDGRASRRPAALGSRGRGRSGPFGRGRGMAPAGERRGTDTYGHSCNNPKIG